MSQCFSTGVPRFRQWYPRVLWDRWCSVTLRPLDAFFRLLVGPKCICNCGFAQNPSWGSLQRSPRPLAGGEGARCTLPKNPSPLSASGVPQKRHGFREQSKLLQRVMLHWKGWKTLNWANTSKIIITQAQLAADHDHIFIGSRYAGKFNTKLYF